MPDRVSLRFTDGTELDRHDAAFTLLRYDQLCQEWSSLHSEEESLNALMTAVVDDHSRQEVILVIDPDGRLLFANLVAREFFKDAQFTIAEFAADMPLSDGQAMSLEVTIADGSMRAVDALVTATEWEGEEAYFVALHDRDMRNMTEAALREAKIAAEHANLMKSHFLANMSHELRTPLNSIMGFSELMRAEVYGEINNNRYRGYLDDMHRSGRQLLKLITDLLCLSKAEAGKLEFTERQFSLTGTLIGVIQSLDEDLKEKDLRVLARGSLPVACILGDEQKLAQALRNILTNAIRYTPKGGQISVDITRQSDGDLELVVSDTGVGMSQAQLSNIFQIFANIDNVFVCANDRGTGLGLALVKHLVDLHGGEVDIQSKQDVGSVVKVTLPRDRLIEWAP